MTKPKKEIKPMRVWGALSIDGEIQPAIMCKLKWRTKSTLADLTILPTRDYRRLLADAKAYRPMVKYDEQEHSSNFGFTIKAYRQGKR